MNDSDAPLVRLVTIHAAIVAVPVLVVALLLQWWVAAVPLAVLVGVLVTVVRARGVDDRIARTIGARPVSPAEVPRLSGLAESVAMSAGVPAPRLFVIDTPSMNAVTWGAGNGPVCLAITSGLLEATDVVGLEAVVGHHLGGAERRSVDVHTLAAALFGPLARGPLTQPVVRLVLGEEDRSVVRADLDGVRATRYPPGMVQVLELIRSEPTELESVPPALAALCFAAPRGATGPFDVHPPLDDRIDLLREI